MKQMYYSGLAVDTRDEIESQVIVDFEEALSNETRRSWIPNIKRLMGMDWNSKTDEDDEDCTAECCWQENVHEDAYVDVNKTEKFIDDIMAGIKDTPQKLPSVTIFPRSLEETKTEVNALMDDELMIMSYSVFGFALRDRTWAKLDLDCMSAVRSTGYANEQTDDDLEEGDKGAFGQLVLPQGHKKMVLSLISQHFRNKGSQESNDKQLDIVRGKGKLPLAHWGLIILLHGAPGVGKTTTAEGVAETFGQPLFQITCGDLGSNPKDVESALQMNFALANRWGCILLLDEADVFLAERRREDFNRNGLVAVFLRVLEYYAGILFLTTNRIGDFDEAFASRIHMSLHYPALDEVSTAKVFRLNLGLIKNRLQDRVRIEEDEIITAAGKHWREHKHARWNGRQIRNACQTALALAEFDAQPKGKKYDIKEKSTSKIHLKLSHLEIVSNAYLEFTDYLKAVHGADADGRAKESGPRAIEGLLQALKSDKREGRDDDRRSPTRGYGQTGRETPLQGFRLRSGSSGHRPPPSMASPSSPDPASQHASGHQGLYSPQRLSHEHASVPGQRVQYNQEKELTAYGPSIEHEIWFKTQPLDAGIIKRLHSLKLIAESCDQGFVSDEKGGNWTWFEIAILEKNESKHPKIKDGIQLT
ncbi:hypothetical protein Daus18300_010264 [Diaporthe australafricana]|uniref:AAA+ ATPase domain-containing protein n=1 Tax=Diaporthe australafricana TaxID=127596 RepID=A0ABR3WB89_9PEZI